MIRLAETCACGASFTVEGPDDQSLAVDLHAAGEHLAQWRDQHAPICTGSSMTRRLGTNSPHAELGLSFGFTVRPEFA